MSLVIDYTENFKSYTKNDNILLAQGKGKDFLALVKLEELKRIGKQSCRYMLEYRELSEQCENPNDESYACVRYSEIQYFLRKEVKNVLDGIKKGDINIFDHFNLF